MWEFRFYSRGGQGAVTASKILVNAAINDGKFAQAIPSYGQERQGAPVYAYARIAEDTIDVKSYVYKPNCVVVFDNSLSELGINTMEGVTEGATLVVNNCNLVGVQQDEKLGRAAYIDAVNLTEQILGPDVPFNMSMLGAVAKATGCVTLESLEKAIKSKIKGEVGELNAKACRRAFEETRIDEKY